MKLYHVCSEVITSVDQASTHGSKKKPDRFEIDALFGLMYFRGILGIDLHMTDRLFSNDSHFVLDAIMSKKQFQISQRPHLFQQPTRKNTAVGNK